MILDLLVFLEFGCLVLQRFWILGFQRFWIFWFLNGLWTKTGFHGILIFLFFTSQDIGWTYSRQNIQIDLVFIGIGNARSSLARILEWTYSRLNVRFFVLVFNGSGNLLITCQDIGDWPYSRLNKCCSFSMDLGSFVLHMPKLWGWTYSRQNVIFCFLWLEQLFITCQDIGD